MMPPANLILDVTGQSYGNRKNGEYERTELHQFLTRRVEKINHSFYFMTVKR
jgi:hypothetical protein